MRVKPRSRGVRAILEISRKNSLLRGGEELYDVRSISILYVQKKTARLYMYVKEQVK